MNSSILLSAKILLNRMRASISSSRIRARARLVRLTYLVRRQNYFAQDYYEEEYALGVLVLPEEE
jgi:hypothetical protein